MGGACSSEVVLHLRASRAESAGAGKGGGEGGIRRLRSETQDRESGVGSRRQGGLGRSQADTGWSAETRNYIRLYNSEAGGMGVMAVGLFPS